MPEIKRNFTKGRMNKDVDERLVPPGEYRDAQNIQVLTSEGSDVGTVQNILGNSLGCDYSGTYLGSQLVNPIPDGATTVGSIADEKNDTLYWLVSGHDTSVIPDWTAVTSLKDIIMRTNANATDGSGCEPVFVDTYAFATSNDVVTNVNQLNVTGTLFGQIETGWSVTGVTDDGILSNSVNVTYLDYGDSIGFEHEIAPIATPTLGNLRRWSAGPDLADPNNIQFPSFPPAFCGEMWVKGVMGALDVSQEASSLEVFVSNCNMGGGITYTGGPADPNDYIGAKIEINPYATGIGAGGQPQFFEVTAATPFQLLNISNGITPKSEGTILTLTPDVAAGNVSTSIEPFVPPIPSSTFQQDQFGNYWSFLYDNNQDGAVVNNEDRIASRIRFLLPPGLVDAPTGWLNVYAPGTSSGYDVNDFTIGDSITAGGVGTLGDTYCISDIDIPSNAIQIETCGMGDGPITFVDAYALSIGGKPAVEGEILLGNDIFANLDGTINLGLNSFTSLIWQGPRVLNFNPDSSINDINIVDDMLYWTDGYYNASGELQGSEPKKINVPRSIQGTFYSGNTHTNFVNNKTGTSTPVKEEHITVIKKSPLSSPTLKMIGRREGNSYGKTSFAFVSTIVSNSEILLTIDNTGIEPLNYQIGDILFLKEDDGSGNMYPVEEPEIRIAIDEIVSSVEFMCSVISISNLVSPTFTNYAVDLDKSYEKLYSLKFPRFALRYKYQDGEYSTYSPFSEPAFIPGEYDYLPNKGYNLGMQNQLRELTLEGIIPGNIPAGVSQVDIIYKESDSPNVYIVDEIKPDDVYWSTNSYTIKEETLKSVLPSNQLLRPWDNVPRKALTQEVTGNRVVYGNYLQNYNLGSLRPTFSTILKPRREGSTIKSIKSIRNYQLGVIYCDEYNRQTPVLSDASATISVSKLSSIESNQIEIQPLNDPPAWATHHKFYIKDTHSEYYNLSLDRYFDAKDGNIWLSFPSNDRNKLDLDTSLHIKKRYKSNEAEVSSNVYKVIDIKNEAPEHIKTRKSILGRIGQDQASGGFKLFDQGPSVTDGTFRIPVETNNEFRINVGSLADTILENFHKRHNSPSTDPGQPPGGGALNNGPLFIRLISTDLGGNFTGKETAYYEVDNIKKRNNNLHYVVRLKKPFGKDAEWVNIDPADLGNPDNLLGGTNDPNLPATEQITLEVLQEIIQNKALFQGRFFAKILKDSAIDESIIQQGEFTDTNVLQTAKVGYLKDFLWEDPGDMSTVWGGNYDSGAHTNAMNDFLNDGYPHNCAEQGYPCYDDPTPDGVAFSVRDYWSFYVWQSIQKQLDDSGSRWVIDEGFATGEEPYWGKMGNNYDNEHVDNEPNGMNSDNISQFENQTASIYGGYHLESTNQFTREFNGNSTAQEGSLPVINGLGHADTADYEYFSKGHGIKNNYIDLSYVGPGRADFNNTTITYEQQTTPSISDFEDVYLQATRWADYWKISGLNSNPHNSNDIGDTLDIEAKKFADQLKIGNYIRFKDDTSGPGGNARIYKMTNVQKFYKLNYSEGQRQIEYPFSDAANIYQEIMNTSLYSPFLSTAILGKWYHKAHFNRRATFRLYLEDVDDGSSPADNQSNYDPLADSNGNLLKLAGYDTTTDKCAIEIVSQNYTTDNDIPFPENPAVFETEPKTSEGVDVFHEISDTIPLRIKGFGNDFAPVGSVVTCNVSGVVSGGQAQVVGWVDDVCQIDSVIVDDFVNQGTVMYFSRPDGTYTTARFAGLANPIIPGPSDTSYFFQVQQDIAKNKIGLGWHNCYAFGNGVESNRIRDTFNSVFIDKGPKVSTTLASGYEEEHRKYGLIYSGLYNSTSGVNDLNQFIAAEKITKDINPTYGSIQKLHSRDSDLVTLCEDKVLKILANKDAVFNADGDASLTATNNVLGQTVPFVGEYGISRNPESFASESYRAYFTDKVRGTVMRLSRDGLTPISDAGMTDWFRDNLKLSNKLVGSYDDRKREYNITVKDNNQTVTYREDVRGWVSFKSFIPENGVSCANQYYTFKEGVLWMHHDDSVDRNTFYGAFSPSSVNVVINDSPGSIKTFHTLSYEGSQSKIDALRSSAISGLLSDKYDIWDVTSWDGTFNASGIPNYTVSNSTQFDSDYYNIASSSGWFVKNIETDKEVGAINEFIEKEGKWFNYIRGKAWQQ